MTLVVIGECMGELSLEGGQAAVGYAGDTFNTAIYLARLGLPVAYATAYFGVPIPLARETWICHTCGRRWEGVAGEGEDSTIGQ